MWAYCLQQPKRVVFSIAALLLALGLGLCNGLGQLDTFIRNGYASMAPRPVVDVVVVSIDAESVASVERWPWPREVHADLRERISAQKPLAVGMDMVLAARHSLLTGASGSDWWWRHIAVGIVDTTVLSGSDGAMSASPSSLVQVSAVSRSAPIESKISPVSTRAPAYKTVTAREVLAGTVAPAMFTGRVVLIGVGASGLLDASTLMRTGPLQIDGGVEASAGIAASLLRANSYVQIEAWHNALFTVATTILLLAALWSQPPARAFLLCVSVVFLGLAASYAAWRMAGVWVAPAALLLASAPVFALLTYRLTGQLASQGGFPAFVPAMAARLHAGGPMTPRPLLPNMGTNGRSRRDVSRDAPSASAQDEAEYQRELQSLRDFLMAAIESLPDIILVCQASGRVMIGNLAAANYFGATTANLRNRSLATLLSGLTPADGSAWAGTDGNVGFARYQKGMECRDANGAEFLLKCAPCVTLPANGEGWIVSLVDVAALHEAERRRDDAMRFLSHDMRSPLTAILALLSLNREDAVELPADEMLSRIRRLASRSLALAESFVQLARAEPPEHEREAVDLADIVMDAADDCWSQAQSKRIVIDVDVPPNAAQTLGDRELIRRAVINLVNNAVKFSPPKSRVVCAVSLVDEDWCVAVRDEGRGIAFEDRELLFKKYARLGECEPDAEPGVGLGLAFTKTVVDRHNGRIEVDSVLGVGSEFRLYLKAMV